MNQNEVNSYQEQDILRLARRYQNTKRAYLLVNPLQAKHIPASPSAALTMMETLGSCVRKISPSSRLVIGFSETATAIGAACAKALGTNCFYLQTTREPLPEVADWIVFSEEHSHATQQKLCSEHLAARLAASQGLVFVDDELSTGKTVRNLVARLRSAFPTLKLPMTAASLINRMDAVNAAQMAAEGITTVSLLTLPATDYAAQIKAMRVTAPRAGEPLSAQQKDSSLIGAAAGDPRRGVYISDYMAKWQERGAALVQSYTPQQTVKSVLVLGTEECMMPALLVGAAWEQAGYTVRCHATTRSPIGIYAEGDYPIKTGVELPSFYEAGRKTYLYNITLADLVLVVSDVKTWRKEAQDALRGTLVRQGCSSIIWMGGEGDV